MCDINTDQGNFLANVIQNGNQSKWWLEFEVNTSLNMNKAYNLNHGLGNLEVLITFLNNILADLKSYAHLCLFHGWRYCCKLTQVNVGHTRTKTFLLAPRNFANPVPFLLFSSSIQMICTKHCGSSIGCIFYFTTYSSKQCLCWGK